MEYKEFDEVVKDWRNVFPILKDFTKQRWYMVVKPFLLGLRIKKEPSYYDRYDYSIYFEIFPLWKNILPVLRDYFFFEKEIVGLDGRPLMLSRRRHSIYFPEAVEYVEKNFGKLLHEKVSIADLIETINKIFFNPYDKEYLDLRKYIILFATAFYYNNDVFFDIIYHKLDKNIKSRKRSLIKYRFKEYFIDKNGIYLPINTKNNKPLLKECIDYNFKHTITSRLSDFKDRTAFMRKVEENCKLSKVAKLNQGEFVGLDEFVMP